MGLFDFLLSPSQKCEKDIRRRLDAFAKDLKSTLPHIVAKDQTEEVVMPMLIETAIDSAHKTLMEDRSSQIQYSIPDNIYESLISKAIFQVYTKHFPKWSKLIEVHSNKDLENAIELISNSMAEFVRRPSHLKKENDSISDLVRELYPDNEEFKRELDKDLDKVNSLLQETTQPLLDIKQKGSRDLSKDTSSKVALLAMNKIVNVINKYEYFVKEQRGLIYSPYPDNREIAGFRSIIDRSWDIMNLLSSMDVTSDFWQHYTQTRATLYRKRQMVSEIQKAIRY